MNPAIKILAVDDVPQNIAAIEAVLTQPGVQIVKAYSGEEALERLLVEDVALALVDVRMPRMDGFELAELMRGAERTHDIPIIFMTAAEKDPTRTFRGYEAGAVDFLHKPVDPQILKSKVDVFVELYSQRRRLSAQLEELRNALRVNEMFAAVLGHDLRNPLNAIAMGAEVLRRAGSDPVVITTADRIHASVQRMGKMIEQLLDVARIRAGGMTLQMKSGDVLQVCRTMRDELESSRASGRIQVTAEGDTRATFDPDRLSQVFSNLIGNALQHGDPEAPVSVNIDGSEQAVVSVRIGNRGAIPPERLKSLFEPFQAGRESQTGLGLGLYVSRQFVQAHGGNVRVSSGAADETAFEFDIPRAPRKDAGQIRLDV
jgi:two-component system, sensor histidine kinase and response regulator